MNMLRPIVLSFLGSNLILLAVNIINILQNGGGPKGRSMTDILGKKPEEARLEDITRLSKAEFKQLFHAAHCPALTDFNGEYQAMNHPSGIMAFGVNVYTEHFFGPGKWIGKAFSPVQPDRGTGYNIFMKTDKNGRVLITRTRKISTFIARSAYDGRDSFHLDYSPHNSFLVHSMRDELRKVNEGLSIGFGSMAAGGGTINPSPFIVYGPPRPWVGAQ